MKDELKEFERRQIAVRNPHDKKVLQAMVDATPARIAVGR